MFADIETQNQAQSNLKHYQEQINILEQRNMSLQSKNERLEREIRLLNGRVTSLESRNRDLAANATAVTKTLSMDFIIYVRLRYVD